MKAMEYRGKDVLPHEVLDEGNIGRFTFDHIDDTLTLSGRNSLKELISFEADTVKLEVSYFLKSLCHPEDMPALSAALSAAMTAGGSFTQDFRVFNAGHGEWRWVSAFGKTYTSPSGELYQLGGFYSIHDSVLLEQTLTEEREADERVKIMLDATPLCCNFWDEKYNNIDCNQEAANLFELSSKQEYLDRFFELSPVFQPCGRLSSELARENIRKAFELGRVQFEWVHQKLNGEQVPAEITLVRVKRKDSYIVAGYTRDLRELKRTLAEMASAEREMRMARDMAEESARAKSDFLANMSHEIRTPMNAILGMTHLILKTDVTQKQRFYLERSEEAAKSLLRIINDILDFSKIEAGKLDLEESAFSLRQVLGSIVEFGREQLREKDIAFSVSQGARVPDLLIGDALRLSQVLINLIGNAVKFTFKGQIVLSLDQKWRHGDRVFMQFSVQDTGIGMSDEQVAGLFTPFTQADTSTTRKYGGTGLGLAICKKLVELMHGDIWCESAPDRGTVFHFTIECGVQPGKEDTIAWDAPLRVLLLGDQRASQSATNIMLQLLRCDVTWTSENKLIVPDDTQLIIMDWAHGGDEERAVREVTRLCGSKAPPILLTRSSMDDARPSVASGLTPVGVLYTPLSISALQNMVEDILYRRNAPSPPVVEIPFDNPEIPDDIRGSRVLLAEDNEINQLLATELLTMEGFQVDVANNGREVLSLLEQNNYDIILMDIQMPEMDGLEATHAIRAMEKYKDLPILAMTAHAMTKDRLLSLKVGMNDHVTKPIEPTQLYNALKTWICPRVHTSTCEQQGGTPS